jgi:hypothetical protein
MSDETLAAVVEEANALLHRPKDRIINLGATGVVGFIRIINDAPSLKLRMLDFC